MQFTSQLLDHPQLLQLSENALNLAHSSPITPPTRPETPDLSHTTDGYATTAVFVPCDPACPPRTIPQRVPFAAPPEAVWSSYHHQSLAITSPVIATMSHGAPVSGSWSHGDLHVRRLPSDPLPRPITIMSHGAPFPGSWSHGKLHVHQEKPPALARVNC